MELSGDFQTSDGCPVVFDEQVGADTLKGV
jgi:hypothetical protein